MKLIDLLVQELPKLGGWPLGIEKIHQSAIDGEIYKRKVGGEMTARKTLYLPIADDPYSEVSKHEYEAALAASKQSVWIPGELPPIGAYAEVIDTNSSLNYGHGESGEVVAHVENTAVIRMSYGLGCFTAKHLRPMRTEEEKARESRIESLNGFIKGFMTNTNGDYSKLGEAVYEWGLILDKLK